MIQEHIINIKDKYDHIISSGSLYFLNSEDFEKTLSKMFQIATKSITFTLEDIPDDYNKKLIDIGVINMHAYNNIQIVENFILSHDWKLINIKKTFMWISPSTKNKIYGTIYRYEKNIISDLNVGNK